MKLQGGKGGTTMVSLQEVERRLINAGLKNRYWGRAEVRELTNIILPDEAVFHAVNGRYEGGGALLVATDRRILLVDKKPMFLNLQDVRYDTIAEVDYFARLLDATVSIRTINTNLKFRTVRQNALRRLTSSVQETIMELRQFVASQQHTNQQPNLGQFMPVNSYDFVIPGSKSYSPVGFPRHQQVSFKRRISKFYQAS